jgi:diketogulonate reductase-like aldo/keto reductase
MAELGVGLVAYSPLGRGFLTGTVNTATLSPHDFRSRNQRFQGESWQANQAIADTVREVAATLGGATPAQVALAWVHAQASRLGVPVVPIPGTKRSAYLEQNAAAMDVTLDDDALAVLQPLSDEVRGRPLRQRNVSTVLGLLLADPRPGKPCTRPVSRAGTRGRPAHHGECAPPRGPRPARYSGHNMPVLCHG